MSTKILVIGRARLFLRSSTDTPVQNNETVLRIARRTARENKRFVASSAGEVGGAEPAGACHVGDDGGGSLANDVRHDGPGEAAGDGGGAGVQQRPQGVVVHGARAVARVVRVGARQRNDVVLRRRRGRAGGVQGKEGVRSEKR